MKIIRAVLGNDFCFWELFLRKLDTLGMRGIVRVVTATMGFILARTSHHGNS